MRSLAFLLRASLALLLIVLSINVAESATTTLRRGSTSDAKTLDPVKATDPGTEWQIIYDLFEGLVAIGPDGKVQPGLAQSWTVSADGRSYTFHLRPGLTWSDGAPLTSSDVVYSFRRAFTEKAGSPLVYFPILNSYEVGQGTQAPEALGVHADDPSVVSIKLTEAWPPFVEFLASVKMLVVPQHVISVHGDRWERPGNLVSNGAYTLSEWVPKSHVKLVRNERYHDFAGVKLDSVVYLPLADNEALSRFRAGELEINGRADGTTVQWLEKNAPGALRVDASVGSMYLIINNKKIPDRRIRRALSLAGDMKTLAEKVLRSIEPPAFSLTGPSLPGYAPREVDFKDWPMSRRIEEARKLMEEAGFTAAKPMRLRYRLKDRESWRKIMVALTAMWRQINVQVEPQVADSATHDSALIAGDYEIAQTGIIAENLLLPDETIGFFGAANRNGNRTFYKGADFNSRLDAARAEKDPARRMQLFAEAEDIFLNRDSVVIPLVHYAWAQVVSSKVRGWIESPKYAQHLTRYLSLE